MGSGRKEKEEKRAKGMTAGHGGRVKETKKKREEEEREGVADMSMQGTFSRIRVGSYSQEPPPSGHAVSSDPR